MHEGAIAENLLAAIIDEAEKHDSKPKKAVITCGQFEGLNEELLSMAFEAIAKDTVCQGCELEVIRKPVICKCNSCGSDFEFDVGRLGCSQCGSDDYDLLPDAPLLLKSIDFETE